MTAAELTGAGMFVDDATGYVAWRRSTWGLRNGNCTAALHRLQARS